MTPRRIVIAPDSLKGSLTQAEAARSIASGIRDACPWATTDLRPIADGGEGMAEVLGGAAGAIRRTTRCADPLGRSVTAAWMYDSTRRRAYIDMACAAGLPLLSASERDPAATTSFGCGEVIADAISLGATHITLGLGGSATNDAGLGALQALGLRITGRDGTPLAAPLTGAMLADAAAFDVTALRSRLAGIEITMPCDVTAPLCGTHGATYVFSPQKGASPAQAGMLEAGMLNVARLLDHTCGRAVSEIPGAGAAGGMAAGFMALAGARAVPGAVHVLRALRLDALPADTLLVVTAEGKADRQTLMGKACGTLLGMCRKAGIPVALLAGRVEDGEALLAAGFCRIIDINSPSTGSCIHTDEEDPLTPSVAARRLREAAATLLPPADLSAR